MSGVTVSYVERDFAEAINDLRVAEYGKAPGFKVNREAIEWNASDDQCCILAAWSGERIIATMRVELADNLGIIEKKLECLRGVRRGKRVASRAHSRSPIPPTDLNSEAVCESK